MLNSNGPKTDPYGTPLSTFNDCKSLLFIASVADKDIKIRRYTIKFLIPLQLFRILAGLRGLIFNF